MTEQIDAETRRLNAFTGLAARGCRLDGARKTLGFNVILPEMSDAFADLHPDVVEGLCRRWLEGPDSEWFPSEAGLRKLAPRRGPALAASHDQAWQRLAEDGIAQLAGCFVRRISQLEPADHQRFGRELAGYMATVPNRREIERWAADWLGADWWQLMGSTPAPAPGSAGTWKAAR